MKIPAQQRSSLQTWQGLFMGYKHDGEIPMPPLFLMANCSTGQTMLSVVEQSLTPSQVLLKKYSSTS